MTVSGTSSLHDWESNVESLAGSGSIVIENSVIKDVLDLQVTVVVKSIKSGKNGMDKKTYEALKESDHPNIKFSISSISKKSSNTLSSKGKLTIAGKTKSVDMDVKYQLSSNEVSFTGDIKIKMSEYEIKPPTAMMGTIKTGDEITISYTALFSQK
jgi:polyisoprenoid-binding protein YceI